MADENTNPAVEETKVDETPISHPNAARRNSLEKQLAQRPDRAELVESKRPARPSPARPDAAIPLPKLTVCVLLSREHPAGYNCCPGTGREAEGGSFLAAWITRARCTCRGAPDASIH